jgi:uncharacterized protein (UPF0548 family)
MPAERRDALCQPLPREPPGEPVAGGAWAIARRLVEEYRMADPAIVRARWDPDAAFVGRVMVLQLRLWRLLYVHARVRVTRVWDDHRVVDGRRARVFGFEYETLPGHLEIGRMDYEVLKFLDDGAVQFRLHARTRASGDGAWWARIGFLLFGRRQQMRFYFRCCARMGRLTAASLGLPDRTPPPAVRLRTQPARA